MQRLDNRSRMSGDVHVRFCESLRGQFPWATLHVACFQQERDARGFMEAMEQRLQKFHLEVAPEKTKLLEFGMFAQSKAKSRGERAWMFLKIISSESHIVMPSNI